MSCHYINFFYYSDGVLLKPIGRYGIYLTNTASNPKSILIYKYEKNILDAVTIRDDDEIHVENEYIKIRGRNNQQWHLQFDEPKSSVDFLNKLKEVNVTIVNDEGSLKDSSSDRNSKVDGNEPGQAIISAKTANISSSIPPNDTKRKYSMMDIINSLAIARNLNENLNPIDENKKNTNVNQLNPPINSSQSSSIIAACPPERLVINTTETPFQGVNSFVSENQIHDSEMNLNSMLSKLDNVLNEIPKMTEQNKVKLENELLKSKISDLEKKITELTKQLQEGDNTKGKCSELEILLMNKVINLENSLSKLGGCESEDNQLNERIRTLECQLQNAEEKTEEYKLKKEILQGTNETLLNSNEELNREIKLLKEDKLEERMKGFTDIIEDSIDMMYRNISEKLDESEEQKTQIKTLLSPQILQTVLDAVKRLDPHNPPKKRKLQ